MGHVSSFSKVFGNGGGTELGEKIAHLKHQSKLFKLSTSNLETRKSKLFIGPKSDHIGYPCH